jgi:hypothetical protein
MIDEKTQREIRHAVELFREVEAHVNGSYGETVVENIWRAAAIMQYLGAREHATAIYRTGPV